MIFTIKLGRETIPCDTLKACKTALESYRSESTLFRSIIGFLLCGDGRVTRKGETVGYFSHNGRFWGFDK